MIVSLNRMFLIDNATTQINSFLFCQFDRTYSMHVIDGARSTCTRFSSPSGAATALLGMAMQAERAMEVYEEARALGMSVDRVMVNAMVNVCAQSGQVTCGSNLRRKTPATTEFNKNKLHQPQQLPKMMCQ